MLLGGKGGCQQCTCVPCDPCTRTCQNPHTGTAFEAVYTRYFEGAEDGNVSDGYLTASGDSDTSDPYDGMDGTGPWFQEVSGSFTLDSTQTRFPCRVTVSFWRNNYALGAATIPPASTALTFEGVFVEVSSGAVVVGDTLIVPADGEVQITGASIPLVSGGGDQSENIPLFYNGSISVAPQCQSASFSIRAKIEWNTQKRQHVLYGLVRECYEEGTPCGTACDGVPSPDTLYLTISGIDSSEFPYGVPNATFVLSRLPNTCNSYDLIIPPYGSPYGLISNASINPWWVWGATEGLIALLTGATTGSSSGYFQVTGVDAVLEFPCGTGTLATGTGTWIFSSFSQFLTGSCSWSVSA
jgi:hypothetical protein